MISNEVRSIIGLVSCGLSMLGSCLIIICYYKLPELKTFGNKLIMYVGLSNLIYAIQTAVEFSLDMRNAYADDSLWLMCKVQGFISTYTSECNLIWITILSITIHDTVKNTVRNMARREKFFIGIGFIIPMVLSAVPFLSGSYGNIDSMCWITDEPSREMQLIQIWGLFFGPLWVCIVVNFVLILKTLARLKKLEIDTTETYFVIRRFLYYPVLWIFCCICGTVNRVIMIAGSEGNADLIDISVICLSSEGFLTAVLFLSDPRIKEAIRNRLGLMGTEIGSSSQVGAEDEEDQDCFGRSDGLEVRLNKGSSHAKFKEDISDSSSNLSKESEEIINSSSNSAAAAVAVSAINPCQNNLNDSDPKSGVILIEGEVKSVKRRRPMKKKKPKTQKQKFQTKGQWNNMEMIEEDSDEDNFDREMQDQNIEHPEQLVLSRNDAKTLFKHHKMITFTKSEHSLSSKRRDSM